MHTTAYKLIKSEIIVEDTTFTTYGISGHKVQFEDVSTDEKKVRKMVDIANAIELEECHLMDFIEDSII